MKQDEIQLLVFITALKEKCKIRGKTRDEDHLVAKIGVSNVLGILCLVNLLSIECRHEPHTGYLYFGVLRKEFMYRMASNRWNLQLCAPFSDSFILKSNPWMIPPSHQLFSTNTQQSSQQSRLAYVHYIRV
jgi:hypothetical protein